MAESKTSKSYDAIVIGAGLNGLVAANYLARAGQSVLLLEGREHFGSTSALEEFGHGYRAAIQGSAELFHPSIARELDLVSYGLEVLPAPGGLAVVGEGAEPLMIEDLMTATVAARLTRRASAAEAAAFRGLSDFVTTLGVFLEPMLTRPLPELEPHKPADVLELLTLGWRLKKLGKADLPEALRFLPMPIRDVLDERLEDPRLKAAIAAPALLSSWLAPRSAGSALTLLLRRPAWTGGLLPRPVHVRGGLPEVLAEAARAAGAEIRTETLVEGLIHGKTGAVRGVVLASGEEIVAHRVISNAAPATTLLRLAEPRWLAPETASALSKARHRGTVAIVQLALGELPDLPAAKGLPFPARLQIGADLDALERAFDPVKYRELPERPLLEVTVPSLADPELAPPGCHVMSVWVQWVPHAPRQGTWNELRDRLGDRVMENLEEHLPGLGKRVIERRVLTPHDLERRCGLPGGSLDHLEPALDQLFHLRPIAGGHGSRTPLEGLYLCGPGTHPGIGTTGLCGRNAALQVLADVRGTKRE